MLGVACYIGQRYIALFFRKRKHLCLVGAASPLRSLPDNLNHCRVCCDRLEPLQRLLLQTSTIVLITDLNHCSVCCYRPQPLYQLQTSTIAAYAVKDLNHCSIQPLLRLLLQTSTIVLVTDLNHCSICCYRPQPLLRLLLQTSTTVDDGIAFFLHTIFGVRDTALSRNIRTVSTSIFNTNCPYLRVPSGSAQPLSRILQVHPQDYDTALLPIVLVLMQVA